MANPSLSNTSGEIIVFIKEGKEERVDTRQAGWQATRDELKNSGWEFDRTEKPNAK